VRGQRTSVGLDVHARSVVGCGLDGETGELSERRLTPAHGGVLSWVRSLPGPVAVTYEAGPTGFGLARFLVAAGVDCQVAAPSKLQRPSGDRVKTDARYARHLARLLHLGEIVAVAVPEAARDLVRAREDVRGDLMSARHRVSKLLLRQGIVYSAGVAWTGVHDAWLRKQKFESAALQLTFDTAYDTMIAAVDRRDRLDKVIAGMAADSPFTPVVTRLGCLRGVSALTAFALAVEIGDWRRLTRPQHRRLFGFGAHRVFLRRVEVTGWHHQNRERARPPVVDRGGLASPAALPPTVGGPAAPLGPGRRGVEGPRAAGEPAAARPVGRVRRPQETSGGRQHRRGPGAGRLVLVPRRLAEQSLSTLFSEGARLLLGQRAGQRAVAAYESEHGPISQQALDEADRLLDQAGLR